MARRLLRAAGMVRDEGHVLREASPRWEIALASDERQPSAPRLRALDVRAQHRILKAMSNDDLARIPLLPQGQHLVRYQEHLDLHDPGRADFLAEGTEVVKPGQRIVAKGDVTGEIWERLIESAHDVVGWTRQKRPTAPTETSHGSGSRSRPRSDRGPDPHFRTA